jgi:hypothetical protein
MGLFDKIKNKVASVTGQPEQEQQQYAQQPQYAAPESESVDDNDDDDNDNDDHDTEYDAREVDEWGGWDPNDWQTFHYRNNAVSQAANEGGEDAANAKCREFGLRDYEHLSAVSSTFQRHFGEQQAFMQAAMNAVMQQQRETLGAAAQSNQAIFEPVEGVNLELYATTQAKAATTGGDMAKWGQVLAAAGCDQAKWERVSAEWNRRMSGQAADMNATMALLTEYSKYFGQAGQGQYGAAAAANAGQAGVLGDNTGAVGAAPCTLERYAEIGGAQSAWAQQGRDVNAMLTQQFGMNALDWSNLSQYWSAQFSSDYTIAGRYAELMEHYTQQYLGAGGANLDSDIDI